MGTCRVQSIGTSSAHGLLLTNLVNPTLGHQEVLIRARDCSAGCAGYSSLRPIHPLASNQASDWSGNGSKTAFTIHVQCLHPSAKLPSRTTRRLPRRPPLRSSSLLLPKRQLTNPIHQRASLSNTTRHTAIAGRDIQAWIPREEVPRSEQQTHRLGRHDGKVLRSWEVSEAECVPQHDIGVFEVGGWVRRDPGGYALRGLARGLRDVAAGGVDLGVVVCSC